MIKNILSFDIGIRNLAYCHIQYNSETNQCEIQNWDIINLCLESEKVKQISLLQLCNRLVDALTEKCFDSDMTIIIENQPVLTNPKMKSIQMMVFTFFVCIGNKEIYLFSPRHKFFAYDGPEIECTLKSKYARRKKLGILYCEYFIKGISDYLDFFTLHKKKDDLSDCFLQALSFLKKNWKKDNLLLI